MDTSDPKAQPNLSDPKAQPNLKYSISSLLKAMAQKLTWCKWQNSVPLSTCQRILRHVFSSSPLGHFSSSSSTVWSTNSNTRYSLFFRRNTSIKFTRWSCRSCWEQTKSDYTLMHAATAPLQSSAFRQWIAFMVNYWVIWFQCPVNCTGSLNLKLFQNLKVYPKQPAHNVLQHMGNAITQQARKV